MFILLSGLSGAQTQKSVPEKLAETMRVSGVGITITTLTDLLAFGCGATSSFISVRNFCIYTGMSLAFTGSQYFFFLWLGGTSMLNSFEDDKFNIRKNIV